MQGWQPFSLRPQIISIIVVTLFLFIVFFCYYVKLKKLKVNEVPGGFVLMIQIFVEYMRNLLIDVLGKRFEKLTPYFIFLMSYLLVSNMIGIFGLENPTTSLTVTLSLGLIMYIGTFVVGFRYQKMSFLLKFCVKHKSKKTGKMYPLMVNPLEVISSIAPLISISFRLWGNITAGSIIVTLWFFLTGYMMQEVPVLGALNLLGGLTIPPIHMYFDLLCGLIQALVFTLLTMVYWTLAKDEGNYEFKDEGQLVQSSFLPQTKQLLN